MRYSDDERRRRRAHPASVATGGIPAHALRSAGGIVPALLLSAVSCFGVPPPTALDLRLDFPDVELLRPQWRRLLVDPERRAYDPVERSGAAFDPARGLVFVGTSQGSFVALDSGMGAVVWTWTATDPFQSAPIYVEEIDLVLVGNEGGVFAAVRPDDGSIAWQAGVGSPVRRPAEYSDRVAYVRTAGQRVYAFEAESGKELWTYERPAPEGYASRADAGLLLDGGHVVTGFSDGTVTALSAVSGDKVWELNVAGEGDAEIVLDDVCTSPVRAGGVVVVASYDNGVFGLDPAEGVQRWSRPDLPHVSGLAVVADDPLVAIAGVGLARLDPEDGRTVWIRRFAAGSLTDPLVRDGLIVLADDVNGLLFFDTLSGVLLENYLSGHGVAGPPAVVGGRLAFLDNEGEFQSFYFLRPGYPVSR